VIKSEIIESLSKRFPIKDVYERPDGRGGKLQYISQDSQIERMNEVFGERWSVSYNIDDYRTLPTSINVYDKETGELIISFRKNVLTQEETKQVFENMKGAAKGGTRTDANGVKREKWDLSPPATDPLYFFSDNSLEGLAGKIKKNPYQTKERN